jgi:hypothetical protein
MTTRGCDALSEEERRAGVSEVVEALAGKPGIAKDRLEPTGHGDPVHGRTNGRREHQAPRVVVPARACEQALGALPDPVRPQRVTDDHWKGSHPPARGGLRLDEHERTLDPLERMADRQRRRVQIDVGPGETEDLALPKANAEGDEVKGLESVTPDGVEETSRLLW